MLGSPRSDAVRAAWMLLEKEKAPGLWAISMGFRLEEEILLTVNISFFETKLSDTVWYCYA